MLFDSNFSFAPKHSREGRHYLAVQRPQAAGTKRDVQLSPHSKADAYRTSQRRSRPLSFRSGSKQQDDRLTPPPSSSGSITSQSSTSSAISPNSDPASRPRTPEDKVSRKMRFFRSRQQPKKSTKDYHTPPATSGASYSMLDENPDIIASALSMDIAALESTWSSSKEMSVPARANTLIPAFPVPPPSKAVPQPPVLKLEPSPFSNPEASECSQDIDHSLLSPFQVHPSVNTQTREQSAYRHSQTADFFGVQMLVNTLNEDSGDEEGDLDTDECAGEALAIPAPKMASRSHQSRLEVPMPAIDESVETSSETSSISDGFGPETPVYGRPNRHSLASTIPTSISGSSGGSSTHSVPKRRSVSSFKGLLSLGEGSSTSLAPGGPVVSKARALSEVISLSSRRSSTGTTGTTATFFCRGNPGSFPNNRHSIGLGSIAGSDIDLEAGLENTTHFPGMEELKKQISWLALREPQVYSSDDDEEEEEEQEINDSADYHQHLASMAVPTAISRRSSTITLAKTTPTPISYPRPTGSVLRTPPRRRARRRTASSECVVLEVLEEMRAADERESLESTQEVSKPEPTQKSQAIGEDLWYSSVISDAVSWDRTLSSTEIGFCI